MLPTASCTAHSIRKLSWLEEQSLMLPLKQNLFGIITHRPVKVGSCYSGAFFACFFMDYRATEKQKLQRNVLEMPHALGHPIYPTGSSAESNFTPLLNCYSTS